MSKKSEGGVKREQFSSSFGFILAATGAAVGLGNLWKFPYIAGENGGGLFVLIYLSFIFILGVPIMLGEMAIGRRTRLSPIAAYKELNPRFSFIGVIGVLCAFVILSYYSVIGGWVLKYIASYIIGDSTVSSPEFFANFTSSTVEPVTWHIIFMAISSFIVLKGIAGGIEKASKIMLPALFVLILIVSLRSVTLPGAIEGVRYFILPDFSGLTVNGFFDILFSAMGQVFFSLSLGMGAIITYGSYLPKTTNLQKSAVIIPALDSIVAILSGFAIMPAVFSFGLKPNGGPALLFETLPLVFAQMPLGRVFGIIFFLLVLFAAVTSAVSLLEVVVSFCIDSLKLRRGLATTITATIMATIGIFASLSFGTLKDFTILGVNIFNALGFLSDKILMPLGGMLMCIFVGYVWGITPASGEITNHGALKFKGRGFFSVMMKYIAPAIILIIGVYSLI